MNSVTIVGRLTKEPELTELESGKKVLNMLLAVQRQFKNENGEYETDFIDCVLWDGIAINTSEYCKKGDLVGVRGRLATEYYETDDKTHKKTNVIAEKITFLATSRHATEN